MAYPAAEPDQIPFFHFPQYTVALRTGKRGGLPYTVFRSGCGAVLFDVVLRLVAILFTFNHGISRALVHQLNHPRLDSTCRQYIVDISIFQGRLWHIAGGGIARILHKGDATARPDHMQSRGSIIHLSAHDDADHPRTKD